MNCKFWYLSVFVHLACKIQKFSPIYILDCCCRPYFDKTLDFTEKFTILLQKKNSKKKPLQISSTCTWPNFTFSLITPEVAVVEKYTIPCFKGMTLRFLKWYSTLPWLKKHSCYTRKYVFHFFRYSLYLHSLHCT